MTDETIQRCQWIAGKPDYYIRYHDYVWGKPTTSDQELFKWLCLEIFHIGLSWQLVLSKYQHFMDAFDDFNYEIVVAYDDGKIEELMQNENIIRYRKKIEATIHNATCFMEVQEEFTSFNDYIWSFTKGEQIIRASAKVPTRNELSDTVTNDLKKRGFKFIGSVTIYSYLQAIGIINDHDKNCGFR